MILSKAELYWSNSFVTVPLDSFGVERELAGTDGEEETTPLDQSLHAWPVLPPLLSKQLWRGVLG